jgi:hypothetical protein
MSEAKPWLQPLHEAKDVSFSVARWIPPTAPSMADDEDLALARLYFRLSFVLSFRSSFQHGGVCSSTTAQCTLARNSSISGVVSDHIHSSRLSEGAGLSGRGLVFAPALPPNRETVGLQGRAERAEACDEPLQRDRR